MNHIGMQSAFGLAAMGLRFLAPLLMIPYLIVELGISEFGKLNYLLAIFGILAVVCDFGFNIVGVKRASETSSDPFKQRCILSSILLIRLVVATALILISELILCVIDEYTSLEDAIPYMYSGLVGAALNMQWYFQAAEKMQWQLITEIATRILMLGAVYAFVTDSQDTNNALAIISGSNFVAGILGLICVVRLISLKVIRWPEVRGLLKSGCSIVRANILVSGINGLNTIVLGNVVTATELGVCF